MEQLCMTQLHEFFESQNTINNRQFGFRKAHSTIHPLLSVKAYIEQKLQNNEFIILVSLDLSKAFDTVDTENILQTKIKYYTGDNNITNWIDSFYKNRQQYTLWEDQKSDIIKNHNISIVQGSSMGPRLFNVYVNDLPNVSDKVEFVLFADDSNFMLSSPIPKELEKSLNRELRDIKDYFDSNGLSINTEKTTYLQFCLR